MTVEVAKITHKNDLRRRLKNVQQTAAGNAPITQQLEGKYDGKGTRVEGGRQSSVSRKTITRKEKNNEEKRGVKYEYGAA